MRCQFKSQELPLFSSFVIKRRGGLYQIVSDSFVYAQPVSPFHQFDFLTGPGWTQSVRERIGVAYLLKRAPCNCLTLYKRLSPLSTSLAPHPSTPCVSKKLFPTFSLCNIEGRIICIDTLPCCCLFLPKKIVADFSPTDPLGWLSMHPPHYPSFWY